MFAWGDNKFVSPTEYVEHGRPLSVLLEKGEDRKITWKEKLSLLRAGIVPLLIIFTMTGLFLMGITSLVQCSAAGATATSTSGRLPNSAMNRITPRPFRNPTRASIFPRESSLG